MAETTNISWSDATLNFWVGCTKVSVGEKGACEFCHAETWAKRWPAYRDTWGSGAARVPFLHPLAKARAITRAHPGVRPFVFSNSLSDFWDNEVSIEMLSAALDVIEATPGNIYLLLTKRPQNIVKRWLAVLRYRRARDGVGGLEPSDGQLLAAYRFPANAALGCTAVTQAEVDRDAPWLLRAKAALKALFAFLSMEPLMGPVDDLGPFLVPLLDEEGRETRPRVDWVITGGESGTKARPSDPAWFRSLRDQCEAAGVPFHFKQWGEWQPGEVVTHTRGVVQTAKFGADGGVWLDEEDLADTDGHIDDEPDLYRVGKDRDPCTLDGKRHDARPVVAA